MHSYSKLELFAHISSWRARYKDNPDCCELISEELAPDGVISKMQVSKRLKLLGFKVPAKAKMQRSNASNELLDNERYLSLS